MKTKFVVFGKLTDTSKMYFNSEFVEEMKEHKYLGNIIISIKQFQQDHFTENYTFLWDQASQSLFSKTCKIKTIGYPVKPIVTHGSVMWGFRGGVTKPIPPFR